MSLQIYYAVHFECEVELVSEWLMLGLESQENGNIYANISKKVTREKDLC